MLDRVQRSWGFVSGFLVASVLFGSLAMAADVVQKDIWVSYLPLKYIFDGVEKMPPADQQGFTLNGRTYVPLRFLAESLGKTVDYDGQTYSIYVGRRPAALPAYWEGFTTEGEGLLRVEYYQKGLLDVAGYEAPNSLLVTAFVPSGDAPESEQSVRLVKDFPVDQKFRSITGKLFTPIHYFGDGKDRRMGHLLFMDENNRVIHKTDTLTTALLEIPFDIPVSTVNRVRVYIVMYQADGLPYGDQLLATQLGVSNFQLNLK